MSRHGDIENLLKFMPNRRDLAHALLIREEENAALTERIGELEAFIREHRCTNCAAEAEAFVTTEEGTP